MMMATAGALKRELIIRPKLAFTFMAMTMQSDPNTTCAKPRRTRLLSWRCLDRLLIVRAGFARRPQEREILGFSMGLAQVSARLRCAECGRTAPISEVVATG